jgi:hypothetical protein
VVRSNEQASGGECVQMGVGARVQFIEDEREGERSAREGEGETAMASRPLMACINGEKRSS